MRRTRPSCGSASETSASDIGRLRDLRFARLVPAESARGYQYLMSMVFESKADLDSYMPHPVHRELGKWARDRGREFLFLDYDLETGWPCDNQPDHGLFGDAMTVIGIDRCRRSRRDSVDGPYVWQL